MIGVKFYAKQNGNPILTQYAQPITSPTQPSPQPQDPAPHYSVRAVGRAPIYRGQPGYGSHLDLDGDGKACEISQ